MTKELEYPDLILLNVGFSVNDGDWNWQGINSPFMRIYYVKEGNAQISLPQGLQALKADHLYLIPSFTLHGYKCDTYFSHYYIHIYEKQSLTAGFWNEFNFPVEIKANPMDLMLVERLLEINPGRELNQLDPQTYDNSPTLLRNIAKNTHQSYYIGIETDGVLLQLFSRFLKYTTPKSNTTDNRISKILSYIRRNIDHPITIGQLSEICHLSNDHFIRLFKQQMHCTPIQYVNQKKIEKAQLMLIVEDMPIKDIAYELSFENLSYFNRLFKKITQHTPQQYREMQRNR